MDKNYPPEFDSIPDTVFTKDEVIGFIRKDRIGVEKRRAKAEPKPESPAELAAIDEWSLAKATEVMNRSYPGGFAQLKAAIQVALIEARKSSIQASVSASREPAAWSVVCGPTAGCGAQYASNLANCPNCGKLNFSRPAGTCVIVAAPLARPASGEARKPLTDAQIEAGREATFSTGNPYCPCDSKTMLKAVRWAERAHNIAAPTSTPSAAKKD